LQPFSSARRSGSSNSRKPGKKDKDRADPDDCDYAYDGDDESEPEDEPEITAGETEQKGGFESSDSETERVDE
jgi:hypothetical protein